MPNHTSNRHAWFREALAAPKGSPARDRYIFRDGLGPDGSQPPSDWASMFGGPAWTRVPDGQWYLHLFAAEQPDLNWENREVRDDFLTTLRFWSDRGVDGFRVDVAHGLAKNLAEPLASLPAEADITDGSLPPGTHPLWDRDEVHDIYAEWRRVFNEYDPPRAGVAEAWVHPSRRPRYASPDGLGQAFNFDLLEANWNAGEFLRVITDNLSDAQRQGSSTTWVLSNHDVVRHATRYGLPPEDRRGHQTARDMAAERRYLPETGSRPGPAAGPGRDPADAGPARLRVPVPGRGTRPARGPRHPLRAGPGSRLLRVAAARRRAATAAGSRCRGRPAARRSGSGPVPPTCRSRPGSARSASRPRSGTRPRPWPCTGNALQLAAQAAGRGEHGVDAGHQRPGAALRPSGRLAVRDQLRAPGRPAAARHRDPRQRPAEGGQLPADTTAWIIPPVPDRVVRRLTTPPVP